MFFLLPNQIQYSPGHQQLGTCVGASPAGECTSDARSCTPIILLRPPSSMVVLHSVRGRMVSCSVGGGMASSFVFAIPSGGIWSFWCIVYVFGEPSLCFNYSYFFGTYVPR